MDWIEVVGTFLSLIFSFGIILALAYYTTKFVAQASFMKYKNRNMTLLEGLGLGTQKSLQLVKVGNKIILLAVSKDGITKIDSFNENELDISMYQEKACGKKILTFQEIAKGIKNYIPNNKKNDISKIKATSFKSDFTKALDKAIYDERKKSFDESSISSYSDNYKNNYMHETIVNGFIEDNDDFLNNKVDSSFKTEYCDVEKIFKR